MAKPIWLTVTPMTGVGNGTLANTGTLHTGRVIRTGTVTVTAVGVQNAQTYVVNQTPKAEFVYFENGATITSPKGGGALIISGRTNSSKLTFTLGTGGTIVFPVPTSYTANGAPATSGTAIAGDPGAVAEFAFSVTVTIPANTTITAKTKDLIVTAAETGTATITINQTPGDATLSVSPATITLTNVGTAVNSTVTSNTTWTVS